MFVIFSPVYSYIELSLCDLCKKDSMLQKMWDIVYLKINVFVYIILYIVCLYTLILYFSSIIHFKLIKICEINEYARFCAWTAKLRNISTFVEVSNTFRINLCIIFIVFFSDIFNGISLLWQCVYQDFHTKRVPGNIYFFYLKKNCVLL